MLKWLSECGYSPLSGMDARHLLPLQRVENPGDTELAVSYWESEEQIKAWRNDPEHLRAQARGKEKWYTDYPVQVVKVLREYAG